MIQIIFLLMLFVPKGVESVVFCSGQLCGSSCSDCDLCDASNCKLPDCYCPSINIPGSLTVSEAPQFVFLSISRSLSEDWYNGTNFTSTFMINTTMLDQNKCPIRPSFYVTNDESDYKYIRYFTMIGSIGLHSVTYKSNSFSTQTQWTADMTTGKNSIMSLSKLDSSVIRMARAPLLSISEYYYSVIKSLGIKIDSSIAANPYPLSRVWPYTLDFGYHNQIVCEEDNSFKKCFKSVDSVKGMWEFVIPTLFDDSGNNFAIFDLDISDYSKAINIVKNNFNKNYKENKAPFGLSFTSDWFYTNQVIDETKLKFIKEIYTWMGSQENVLFATENMIIDWMKFPEPFINLKSSSTYQCPTTELLEKYKDPCDPYPTSFCDFPNDRGPMHVCSDKCPTSYPNIRNETCGDGICALGIEDCSCEKDCGLDKCLATNNCLAPCFPNWPGWATFKMSEKTETYMCGDIIFNNPRFEHAADLILTANIYRGQLFRIKGAKNVSIKYENYTTNCFMESWRIKPYLMNIIYPKTNYSFISLCAYISDSTFTSEFVSVGAEFSAPILNCTLDKCPLKCGDGICQEEERFLCNSDCSIPFTALFKEKLIGLTWGIFLFLIFFIEKLE